MDLHIAAQEGLQTKKRDQGTVWIQQVLLSEALITEIVLAVVLHEEAPVNGDTLGSLKPTRRLLGAVPSIEVIEIPEGEFCCGSAGTYNIEQPEVADTLGAQKAEKTIETGAEAVAAGNIGCLVQIRRSLEKKNSRFPVYHTIQLLDNAYSKRE